MQMCCKKIKKLNIKLWCVTAGRCAVTFISDLTYDTCLVDNKTLKNSTDFHLKVQYVILIASG